MELAHSLPPHTALAVIGELGSFVSRRCQNHHVCIKAVALFPLTGAVENWGVKIEKALLAVGLSPGSSESGIQSE